MTSKSWKLPCDVFITQVLFLTPQLPIVEFGNCPDTWQSVESNHSNNSAMICNINIQVSALLAAGWEWSQHDNMKPTMVFKLYWAVLHSVSPRGCWRGAVKSVTNQTSVVSLPSSHCERSSYDVLQQRRTTHHISVKCRCWLWRIPHIMISYI